MVTLKILCLFKTSSLLTALLLSSLTCPTKVVHLALVLMCLALPWHYSSSFPIYGNTITVNLSYLFSLVSTGH